MAKFYSCRKTMIKRNLFSVIFRITNKYKKNWISNGIDLSEGSFGIKEKEVLFQPFSFYYLKDVIIDLNKRIADIDLETIGKKEILEYKIKTGGKIVYDKELGIVKIKDN